MCLHRIVVFGLEYDVYLWDSTKAFLGRRKYGPASNFRWCNGHRRDTLVEDGLREALKLRRIGYFRSVKYRQLAGFL